ncbi:MAG: UMP kinase [Nanoarchaeota archaeon]
MKKEVIVLSLGGSQIIPNNVDKKYLKNFKKIILKNKNKYKFIIICGGGSIARKYISAINPKNEKMQSLAGIATTRMNARFMNYFFGQEPKNGIPLKMQQIKNYLKKQDIIFCGALGYHPNQTSDSTSAQIATKLKTKFINLTNVKGLYTKNPKKYKDAKFIEKISWNDFNKMTNKLKFKPGQHFVLDQKASKIIKQNKIPTYIIGLDTKQLDNLLHNKRFIGTTIEN